MLAISAGAICRCLFAALSTLCGLCCLQCAPHLLQLALLIRFSTHRLPSSSRHESLSQCKRPTRLPTELPSTCRPHCQQLACIHSGSLSGSLADSVALSVAPSLSRSLTLSVAPSLSQWLPHSLAPSLSQWFPQCVLCSLTLSVVSSVRTWLPHSLSGFLSAYLAPRISRFSLFSEWRFEFVASESGSVTTSGNQVHHNRLSVPSDHHIKQSSTPNQAVKYTIQQAVTCRSGCCSLLLCFQDTFLIDLH